MSSSIKKDVVPLIEKLDEQFFHAQQCNVCLEMKDRRNVKVVGWLWHCSDCIKKNKENYYYQG